MTQVPGDPSHRLRLDVVAGGPRVRGARVGGVGKAYDVCPSRHHHRCGFQVCDLTSHVRDLRTPPPAAPAARRSSSRRDPTGSLDVYLE